MSKITTASWLEIVQQANTIQKFSFNYNYTVWHECMESMLTNNSYTMLNQEKEEQLATSSL